MGEDPGGPGMEWERAGPEVSDLECPHRTSEVPTVKVWMAQVSMKAQDQERHLVCDHRAFVVLPETKSRTVAQTPGRGALGMNVP